MDDSTQYDFTHQEGIVLKTPYLESNRPKALHSVAEKPHKIKIHLEEMSDNTKGDKWSSEYSNTMHSEDKRKKWFSMTIQKEQADQYME